jgi:integrase
VDPAVGLHFHDLRHTGNKLRSAGASLRDLMEHMGHSTQQAALIYQHSDLERQQAMAETVSKAIRTWHGAGTDDDDEGEAA